ncbi:MAG: hypothetical protein OCD76_14100 [Reichenbachiella sp.]
MDNSPILKWHAAVSQLDESGVADLIDKSCVFYSPVVFKPQEGKRLTVMYLLAAFNVFKEASSFVYIKEIKDSQQAVLEFEATIDGVVINGIDMITWNEAGLITEFKVMVRPLQGIDKLKEKMFEQISNMGILDKLKFQAGNLLDKLKK